MASQTTLTPVEDRSPIARYFGFAKYNVTLSGEIMAGVTTFLVMMYIAFVNPGILTSVPDSTGFTLDKWQTISATCFTAAFLCLLMGLYAKRPFAMAPGLGINAVVAFQLVASQHLTWGAAFGLITIEGLVITILVLTNFRQAIMEAVPDFLKKAIAAGIGLFILYIGLNEMGLVSGNPIFAVDRTAPPVQLGSFDNPLVLLSVIGLFIMIGLQMLKVRGAFVIGILVTTVISIIFGLSPSPNGIVGTPALPGWFGWQTFDAFGQQNAVHAILNSFALMLSDFFDTLGTFLGVGLLAGFVVGGMLPNVKKPLLVDSVGPIVGGIFGASSNTTYIESGAGVSAGGRTGLVSVVVGLLFGFVPFFSPVISIVPAQATAPALVLVGYFMMESLSGLNWKDITIAFPVLITMITMPLTYSITNGIGFGVITYTVIALMAGRAGKVHWLMYVTSLAFLLYFLIVPIQAWLGIS
jgi:AGZA family xanthine/uracil permease-like MFS transporter